MEKIKLIEPKLDEYWYEEKLLNDPNTMNYNAGYDVTYHGYHYDTGCIDFGKDKWIKVYEQRKEQNNFFAYIKDLTINEYVGYVNYQYNNQENRYECGIVIEANKRGNHYGKEALQLLCKKAKENKVESLYDSFEKERNSLTLFESVGFKIIKEISWKKFENEVKGVIVKIEL